MGTTNFDKLDVDELDVAGVDVTAAMAEVSAINGLTATAAELNYAADVSAGAAAVTVTSDGLTTGIIPSTAKFVTITSDSAAKWCTLPAPVVGKELYLLNAGTGYEIRSSDPGTVGINGGVGANAESAVGANLLVHLICVSATNWIGDTKTAAGVVGVVEVASA
jgi:hypothetical protein